MLMREKWKRILSLTLFLCVLLAEIPLTALAEEQMESGLVLNLEEQAAVPQDSPGLETEDTVSGSGKIVLSTEIGEVHPAVGPPEGETVFDAEGQSASTGSDVALGFDDISDADIQFDDANFMEVTFEEEAETLEAEAAVLQDIPWCKITTSPSNLVLTEGTSQTVRIQYDGNLFKANVGWGTNDSNLVSAKFGAWKNKSSTLTISGKKAGTAKIQVVMSNALTGLKLDTAEIKVVVVSQDTLTLSASKVNVKPGSQVTVTAVVGGYKGNSHIQCGNNNKNVVSCTTGSWSGNCVPLTIKGIAEGTATIKVQYVANDKVIGEKELVVDCSSPGSDGGGNGGNGGGGGLPWVRLTLNVSSLSVEQGKNAIIQASYSGCSSAVYLQCGSSNPNAFTASAGSWSGNTAPLTITGKAPGSGTLTVYLKSQLGGITLASASVRTVSVYAPTKPDIETSPAALTLKSTTCDQIRFTVSGVSGKIYLCYENNASRCYSLKWGSWSGYSIPLMVTGLNAGSGKVTVTLKDSAGKELKRVEIPVTVQPEGKPSLKASVSSLSVSRGGSKNITFSTSNCNEEVLLRCISTGTISCAWETQSPEGASLRVTGVSKGSGQVTVELVSKSSGAVLDSRQISVQVGGKNITDVSYSFKNYSRPRIPLELCQIIFGKTEFARIVYEKDVGNGGVCFGMASTSGMIYQAISDFALSQFSGASSIAQLRKDTRNISVNLLLHELIEAMHVSQLSIAMTRSYGVASVANTAIREIDAGRPIVLCIYGNGAGHAILGYDYFVSENTLNITVYDSNYPQSERTLVLRKSSSDAPYSSWSYSPLGWGGGSLNCITISTLENIWRNRGKSEVARTNFNLNDEDTNVYKLRENNLLATSENDFRLYVFDEEHPGSQGELALEYQNGELKYQNEKRGVQEIELIGVLPDSTGGQSTHFFTLPVDYYTIEDTDTTGDNFFSATLTNLDLSVSVEAGIDSFSFYAMDKQTTVGAILDVPENVPYSITLGSSLLNAPAQKISGLGTGEIIGASLDDGILGLLGIEANGMLSIESKESIHTIATSCSEGGSITPVDAVKEGESRLISITPASGYRISRVYVDGEDVGITDSWNFENITDSHSVYAQFSADISACTVKLSAYNFTLGDIPQHPTVTVTSPEGSTLVEGTDYQLHYTDDNVPGTASVFIESVDGGSYAGFIKEDYQIEAKGVDSISVLSRNSDGSTVTVNYTCTQKSILLVVAYNEQGKLYAVEEKTIVPEETFAQFDFSKERIPSQYTLKAFIITDDRILSAHCVE